MIENYPGTNLPHPQKANSKEVPSTAISAANMKKAAVLQPSADSAIQFRGTCLKISTEKKANIGQHAAEHRVLATVWYYATKLPPPLEKLGAYLEECIHSTASPTKTGQERQPKGRSAT